MKHLMMGKTLGKTPIVKKIRRGLPPLAILLLGIPALQPLFSSRLTCGFDNVFHLWRSVEMAELLQSGTLFSRWAPHMARGYGYPLYLFQSPLSAYGTAVFALLGFSWPVAINTVYALGLLLSAVTTWWLVRDLWDEMGGMVAAVAMLFAPFHLYVVMYRGSLSETVAWVFPPLVLWGLRRWQLFGQRRGLGTAVLSLTALFFAHDVTAYTFFPFFMAWGVGLSWSRYPEENWTQIATSVAFADERGFEVNRPRKIGWKRLKRGGLALLLGLGGGAFFWIPAVFERGSIQFDRAGSAWPFLYQNNFLPLEQLFALPRNADPELLNDWPQRGLGAVLLVCVLLGVMVGWRQAGEKRWATAALAFIFTTYLFIISPFSTFLWENLSLLAAFQFPWRFLAPATLAAAMLAGAVVEVRSPKSEVRTRLTAYGLRFTIGLGIIVALSVFHWGWLYPDHCDLPGEPGVAEMVAWEASTHTLGTTASRELLPVAVKQVPQEPDLPPPWQSRLLPQDLPAGAQFTFAEYESLQATIELTSPTPFMARYRAFDFPGWQVTVNGEPVPITPSDPGGLITFPVPNGRSTIHISFTETPLRRFADALSILSVGILCILLIFPPKSSSSPLLPISPAPHPPRSPAPLLPLLLLALTLITVKAWLVDTQRTPLHHSRLAENGELDGVGVPTQLTFGDPANPAQFRLLGHDGVQTAVPADQPLIITLYWQPLTRPEKEYRVGLTLVDENGRHWSAAGLRDYRWVRNPDATTTWLPGQYALTGYFVDALPGTPPGRYTLAVSFFEQTTFAPLTIYDTAAQPLGPSVPLAVVMLTNPQQPWQADQVEMQNRLHAAIGGLMLWGADVDRRDAAPGDTVWVTLYFSTKMAMVEGDLELVDAEGTAVSTWPIALAGEGEGVWRHQQALRLPPDLDDGSYQWQFSLPGDDPVQWAEITVDAPDRRFTTPDIERIINITFGEQIALVGVNLDEAGVQSGEPVNVELVWQGVAEMTESYRVFVHLLGPDGTILAQSDGIPAAWTRPTTGWLPGEYVIDPHQLIIPPELQIDSPQLRVGIYLPGDARLTTPEGDDSVLIPLGSR